MHNSLTTLDPTEPDWAHVALVTIDMQNDFALPQGPGFVPGTDEIVPALADLIDAFRKSELPIFHAVRLYLEDGSNAERCRQRLLQSGLSLARPGTSGARTVDVIRSSAAPEESSALLAGEYVPLSSSEWLFYKSRWSAFYGTGLEERLLELDVDTVVVAGCNFPNCPSATLFDATERDFRAVLVSDAVSGLSEAGLRWCTGIGVMPLTVAQVQAQIQVRK
jgi:nicotinamidase-related amidase